MVDELALLSVAVMLGDLSMVSSSEQICSIERREEDALLFCSSSSLADRVALSTIDFLQPVRSVVVRGELISLGKYQFVLPVSGLFECSFVSILRSTDAF